MADPVAPIKVIPLTRGWTLIVGPRHEGWHLGISVDFLGASLWLLWWRVHLTRHAPTERRSTFRVVK